MEVDPCGACGYRCCATCAAALALLTLESSGEAAAGTLEALDRSPREAAVFRLALAGQVNRGADGRLARAYLLGQKVRGMIPAQSARDTAAYSPDPDAGTMFGPAPAPGVDDAPTHEVVRLFDAAQSIPGQLALPTDDGEA